MVPLPCNSETLFRRGPVAQWLEPAAHNRLVGGSSPSGPTKFFKLLKSLDNFDTFFPFTHGNTHSFTHREPKLERFVMYLWFRPSGFIFQQGIPRRLHMRFGKTPIRVNLGLIPSDEARRRARILAGVMTARIEEATMTREILSASLSALAAEISGIERRDRHLMFTVPSHDDVMHADHDPAVSDLMQEHRSSAQQQRRNLKGVGKRLDKIGLAMADDKIAWQSERQTFETVVKVLGSVERPVATVATEAETEVDARAFKPSTLLSVAGRSILEARKAALNPDDDNASRYEERLETSFASFLDVVGDKPLSYYLPIHMQDFATFLARVPLNRKKVAIFRDLTLKQAVEKNAKLPLDQRKPCLAETTVTSYISEVKNIWSRVAAGVPGLRDMGAYRVTMPKDTAAAIDRKPISVPSLNIWLRDSATEKSMKKPHRAWLPLAGLLTGMRLSELVYLQRSDIVDFEGFEIIDLTTPLIIDGQKVERPTKTGTSKRYVALHPLLHECGFVDYVKSVKSTNGFVFAHFHATEDPPLAAGKQMINWMKTLKIHVHQKQVFHSLRHNAKDWFRGHLGKRLSDKQCGHRFVDVSDNYGESLLLPEEIQQIMEMPAPRRLDFSAFLKMRT
jgi:integrase